MSETRKVYGFGGEEWVVATSPQEASEFLNLDRDYDTMPDEAEELDPEKMGRMKFFLHRRWNADGS